MLFFFFEAVKVMKSEIYTSVTDRHINCVKKYCVLKVFQTKKRFRKCIQGIIRIYIYITKTRLFKYTENLTTKKIKIFR